MPAVAKAAAAATTWEAGCESASAIPSSRLRAPSRCIRSVSPGIRRRGHRHRRVQAGRGAREARQARRGVPDVRGELSRRPQARRAAPRGRLPGEDRRAPPPRGPSSTMPSSSRTSSPIHARTSRSAAPTALEPEAREAAPRAAEAADPRARGQARRRRHHDARRHRHPARSGRSPDRRVRPGYQDWTKTVSVSAPGVIAIDIPVLDKQVVEPPKPVVHEGTLKITTLPNAEILLDSAARRDRPLRGEDQERRPHAARHRGRACGRTRARSSSAMTRPARSTCRSRRSPRRSSSSRSSPRPVEDLPELRGRRNARAPA